jgi:hypothetical protein
MANQPRPENPPRTIRCEDDLWEAAGDLAIRRDENISQMVRRLLRREVEADQRRREKAAG